MHILKRQNGYCHYLDILSGISINWEERNFENSYAFNTLSNTQNKYSKEELEEIKKRIIKDLYDSHHDKLI